MDGEENKHVLEKTDELMTETILDETSKHAESKQGEEKKTFPSEETKQVMHKTNEVVTETRPEGEKQSLQSTVNTPASDKPTRKHITPMAIDP